MKLFALFSITMLTQCTGSSSTHIFIPQRIERSAEIEIQGAIENVFPLFGPIREMEWAHGWNPEVIFPERGTMEEHMIFRTKANNAFGTTHKEYYTWVISQYEAEQHLIEYTVSTTERIWFIKVQCKPYDDRTKAIISNTYTGLTDEGNAINKQALEKMYEHELKDWEEAINHYLKTGKQLVH